MRGVLRPVELGRVTRSIGLVVEATGVATRLGDLCVLGTGDESLLCETVGFEEERCMLMPLETAGRIYPGMPVRRWTRPVVEQDATELPLGRIVDGLGRALDGQPSIGVDPAAFKAINPLQRQPISGICDVGIRVINGLLTVGKGQRMGLFAGSGVGKSVLMGMLARFVDADVVIVALVGERGREVQEFIRENLGDGMRRAIVVASPADDSAALRIRSARFATALAERFRAQGKHVLLLMDSLTRVAQAQREIGLATGEPPSAKGYTPSSFAILPQIVERAGTGTLGGGAITAFYTVLVEEDDLQDPIVDACRAILDGHIVLNRQLAEQGIFPAIDVSQSVSRIMMKISPQEQLEKAQAFKALWARYQDQFDLISLGAYQAGSDPVTDRAIALRAQMEDYVRQDVNQPVAMPPALAELEALISGPPPVAPAAFEANLAGP